LLDFAQLVESFIHILAQFIIFFPSGHPRWWSS